MVMWFAETLPELSPDLVMIMFTAMLRLPCGTAPLMRTLTAFFIEAIRPLRRSVILGPPDAEESAFPAPLLQPAITSAAVKAIGRNSPNRVFT
jgi:hypothetical protein